MFGMGMPEILLIVAIALIVIGPRKLPELGRGLGRAMREFRQATNEFKSSLNIDDDLGDVRRSLSEMKGDLKSTLNSAAFGDPAKPRHAGGEPTAAAPDPPSDSPPDTAPNDATPEGAAEPPPQTPGNGEEDRDAGR